MGERREKGGGKEGVGNRKETDLEGLSDNQNRQGNPEERRDAEGPARF